MVPMPKDGPNPHVAPKPEMYRPGGRVANASSHTRNPSTESSRPIGCATYGTRELSAPWSVATITYSTTKRSALSERSPRATPLHQRSRPPPPRCHYGRGGGRRPREALLRAWQGSQRHAREARGAEQAPAPPSPNNQGPGPVAHDAEAARDAARCATGESQVRAPRMGAGSALLWRRDEHCRCFGSYGGTNPEERAPCEKPLVFAGSWTGANGCRVSRTDRCDEDLHCACVA